MNNHAELLERLIASIRAETVVDILQICADEIRRLQRYSKLLQEVNIDHRAEIAELKIRLSHKSELQNK
jgi:hypothetical protein